MDEGVAWYPAPPLPIGERRIEYPWAGGKDGDFFSEDAAGLRSSATSLPAALGDAASNDPSMISSSAPDKSSLRSS